MTMDKEQINHATVFSSIEEAVETLGLSRRVKWKNYLGYLCRYTKKDICPEFVVDNGLPVEIKENDGTGKIRGN